MNSAVILLLLGIASSAIGSSITGTVSLSSNGPFIVDVTFQNVDDQSVELYFLKWNTPFDSLAFGNSFIVTRDGEELPYIGALAKRRVPQGADYQKLSSSEVQMISVDLSKAFDFSLKGVYTIQMIVDVQVARSLNNLENVSVISLASEQISFQLDPASANIVRKPEEPANLGISYVSCSSSQQTTVAKAWEAFLVMSDAMNSYMSNNQQEATYLTFFGSTSYWSTVANVIANEVKAGDAGTVKFNCAPPDCGSDSVFAYVYPTDTTKTVYLCGAFWKAALTGYDSQPGVIVHELSHFNSIGGTDDWAYGLTACKNLAKSNPARAVNNADNYEYYGETVPK